MLTHEDTIIDLTKINSIVILCVPLQQEDQIIFPLIDSKLSAQESSNDKRG